MIAHPPPYSHGYNLAAKLVCFLLGVAGVVPMIPALDAVRAAVGIGPGLPVSPYVRWPLELGYVAGIFVPLLLVWRLVYKPYLVPAANWMFLRRSRKTDASWSDAVALTPLFTLDKHAVWYPVPEVLAMSEGQRLAYLYALAEHTGRLADAARPRLMPAGLPPAAAIVAASAPASGVDRHPEVSARVRRLPDRLVGALLLTLGLGFGYWGVVSPLLAARRHDRSYHYEYEATVATPALLVIGLLYLVLGPRASRLLRLKAGERPSQIGLVLVALLVLAGFVLHGWVELRRELGG